MVNINPYHQYQKNAVSGAASEELVLMLYNGAVKFIRQGLISIEESNIEGAHMATTRAQDIISHLRGTLDMGFELSGGLAALYEYIESRLVEANIKKDAGILGEALDLTEGLRDTWLEAIKVSRSSRASGQ